MTAERPLATMVVFAYNQQDIVNDAIQSVFAQTYSPLEIILSDDCSPDATFAVMEEAARTYQGPHEIRLNRNETNLGAIGHVNRLFELARGELIIINSGDDRSRRDRAQMLVDAFVENGRPLMLHSLGAECTPDGKPTGVIRDQSEVQTMGLRKAAVSKLLCIGATCAWNPEIFHKFGPISDKHAYGDLIFSFRAKLLDSLVHVDAPLLEYRLGGYSTRRAETRQERDSKRWKRKRTQIAVLRQRRADIEKVAPERQRLIRLLTEKIGIEEERLKQMPGHPDKNPAG